MGRLDDRLDAVRGAMAERGIDLLALGPGAHMHWMLGWHPHPDERLTLLVIGADMAEFVVPSVNAEQAAAHAGVPTIPWRDEDGPADALRNVARRAGRVRRLALDEAMRTDFALPLVAALGGPDTVFAAEVTGRLRMIKDADEIAALRASARLSDDAMRAAWAAVRAGATEAEIGQAARKVHEAAGARTAFMLCAGGPNGAFPHHATGNRPLADGDAIVLDMGAFLQGWPSDMTRMACAGRPPEGYEEVHAVVERAWQAAADAARPGVPAKAVDLAARGVIEKAGYGEYFVHRTGHGMGLEVHEPPWITATSETPLAEGMVFSIEPGIYIPGRFGIRLEDIVVLGEGGPAPLSALPRDLHVSE